MRAPNGYGGVVNLGNGRRKPWAVRVVCAYKPNKAGSLTPQYKYISFHKTRAEAFIARDRYNLEKEQGRSPAITVLEVYELFREQKTDVAESTRRAYSASFNSMQKIHEKKIAEVTFLDLQAIIDQRPSTASKRQTRSLMSLLWEFAEQRQFVAKNIARALNVGRAEKSMKHYKFSPEEIRVLKANEGNEFCAFTLALIYTGARPGELGNLPAENVKDGSIYIKGGKTANARRIIPIHPEIRSLIEQRAGRPGRLFQMPFDSNSYTAFIEAWEKALEQCGIATYIHPETGAVQKHKPHDGRHTFTSAWKSQKLDEGMRRYIQGHSQTDIGGQVYTHYDPDALRAEMGRLEL